MQEATPQMTEEWKAVWRNYKDKITPNRKTGNEVMNYLISQYPVTKLNDDRAAQTVTQNVLTNKPFSDKLPKGTSPLAAAYLIKREGIGETLYQNRENIYKGIDIFVGIDLITGYFCVEGSSMLWDELFAFRGLDEDDIENYYCVTEYISCLERFGLLEQTFGGIEPA